MRTRILGAWLPLLLVVGAGSAWADCQDSKAVAAKTAPVIDLDLPMREGDLKITGRSNCDRVMVRVYSGWTSRRPADGRPDMARRLKAIDALMNAETEQELEQARTLTCVLEEPVGTAGPFAVTNGAFEGTLKQRLNSGECVVVENAATPISGNKHAVNGVARSVVLDFGRLRGYFSLGGAVSRYRSNFSQTDTFVGLTSDSLIAGRLVEKRICIATEEQIRNRDEERQKRPELKAACDDPAFQRQWDRQLALRSKRIQLNAVIDGSVGFRLATTGSTNGAAAVTGGQPAQVPFQRPDQLVFGSNQPAFAQIGLHAPMSASGMDWRNDGKLYSFYAGPIVKIGVQASEAPIVVNRVVAIDLTKASTDTARYSTRSEQLRSGALPFWGYGFRTGIYQYELLGRELRQRQIANDPVAYLDLTFAKATAYRSYQFSRSTNEAGTVDTVAIDSSVGPRLAIEARMKIPYLPALIGVDANVSRKHRDEEPNEFRFIVAFRVDAQKALGRIFNADALRQ